MTYPGGNIELTCPFVSVFCVKSGNYFRGTPCGSALTLVIWVSEQFVHLLP
jgi:hypothetical protein